MDLVGPALDASTALLWAREQCVPFAVRSGGHRISPAQALKVWATAYCGPNLPRVRNQAGDDPDDAFRCPQSIPEPRSAAVVPPANPAGQPLR
jgi:hypothetical protein